MSRSVLKTKIFGITKSEFNAVSPILQIINGKNSKSAFVKHRNLLSCIIKQKHKKLSCE